DPNDDGDDPNGKGDDGTDPGNGTGNGSGNGTGNGSGNGPGGSEGTSGTGTGAAVGTGSANTTAPPVTTQTSVSTPTLNTPPTETGTEDAAVEAPAQATPEENRPSTTLGDSETPLAAFENEDSAVFAVMNPILAALGLALLLLLVATRRLYDRRRLLPLALGAFAMLASSVLLLVTVNINAPLVLVDRWTIVHEALFVVGALALFTAYLKSVSRISKRPTSGPGDSATSGQPS
ncbi:MAG: hypothetical protein LBH64_00805, partial [Coriobacteriales bacterium]|nr:hypothetical protein [Coriobacteriales bacterium]